MIVEPLTIIRLILGLHISLFKVRKKCTFSFEMSNVNVWPIYLILYWKGTFIRTMCIMLSNRLLSVEFALKPPEMSVSIFCAVVKNVNCDKEKGD